MLSHSCIAMENSKPTNNIQHRPLVQEVVMGTAQRTSTCPKTGIFQEVCREWLVIEDSALAHQLQDQEIAAHYGNNRERNRIVRVDVSQARTEQEDELKQALALQQYQQQLRAQQEKEDEMAARRLAQELEEQEELERRKRFIQDKRYAQQLQSAMVSKPENPKDKGLKEPHVGAIEPICSKVKMLDMNQPMSEDEAREWQERCDAELARKLQQEEEEESQFRRDVTDLGRKLAIEAKDLELARALQEKEKARLKKAKEKARLKAQQAKAMTATTNDTELSSLEKCSAPETQNIAACIDPTWSRRYHNPEMQGTETGIRTQIPITDLDFPAPVQGIVSGHRRPASVPRSEPNDPEPVALDHFRSKPRKGCSHQ